MKNKIKKVVIFFGLIIFGIIPTKSFAKEIVIDDIKYESDKIIEQDNFIYNPNTDTLTLTNANLNTIKTNENLKIVLIGNNYIVNDNITQIAISGKRIEIEGEGILILESVNSGISGEKITINRTNLKINSKHTPLTMLSTSNHDLIINNSNLELESEGEIFNIRKGNIYLNNSNIKIIKANDVLSTYTKNLYVNNTNLNILEAVTMNYNQELIYVDGNSYLKIKTTKNYFLDNNYVLGSKLNILSSDDDINYQEINPLKKSIYIKIYNQIDERLLNEKAEELKKQEQLLNNKENSLNIEFEKIISFEEELKKKEESLNQREINLNLNLNELKETEEKLIEKEENLDQFEVDLLTEKENLNQLKLNLETEKLEVSRQQKNIKEDLLVLNDFSISLTKKEEKILKKEDELNVLETTLEHNCPNVDYIKNPKTYDKFRTSISVLFFSVLGMIILVFFKRRGDVDG